MKLVWDGNYRLEFLKSMLLFFSCSIWKGMEGWIHSSCYFQSNTLLLKMCWWKHCLKKMIFGLMMLRASKEKPALWGHFPIPSLMWSTPSPPSESEMKFFQPTPGIDISWLSWQPSACQNCRIWCLSSRRVCKPLLIWKINRKTVHVLRNIMTLCWITH